MELLKRSFKKIRKVTGSRQTQTHLIPFTRLKADGRSWIFDVRGKNNVMLNLSDKSIPIINIKRTSNKPFYGCVLRYQAFEWKWGSELTLFWYKPFSLYSQLSL